MLYGGCFLIEELMNLDEEDQIRVERSSTPQDTLLLILFGRRLERIAGKLSRSGMGERNDILSHCWVTVLDHLERGQDILTVPALCRRAHDRYIDWYRHEHHLSMISLDAEVTGDSTDETTIADTVGVTDRQYTDIDNRLTWTAILEGVRSAGLSVREIMREYNLSYHYALKLRSMAGAG